MDEKYNNRINRSLQVGENCNALWPRGQNGDPTIYSSDSCHHCVGRSSLALEIQHKSTSEKEFRKPGCISGENAGDPCGQDCENGGDSVGSSIHGKSHIFHPERENQELLLRGSNSRGVWKNEGGEKCDIQSEQTGCESESKYDEYNIFKCPNREKIKRLQEFLGSLCRVNTMEGSSWNPKTPCNFIHPNDNPNGTDTSSMSSVQGNNKFDLSCNNSSLVVEMIANKSDSDRVAASLHLKIESIDLRVDGISSYLMEIAMCGFNHIIIIGEIHCGLLFLDCYERVFMWDSLVGIFLFCGNFFEALFEKPCEVPWAVSLDGTVWEVDPNILDSESPEECNSYLVKDKKKDKKKTKKKGKNKNQKKHH
ncbi:hypothetical protein GLOIN_2v1471870 [Rhizophagus clarus]|nr:hypothetical protein GLOIN_2v1471870 [Rhizophagus clarus]